MKWSNIKYLVSLITFLLSTTGVAVSKHYSGDKLFDVSIWGEAESCCAPGCDCCETDFEYIHISDNFEVPPTKDIQITILDLLQNFNFDITSFYLVTKANCIKSIQKNNCLREDIISPPSDTPAITQNFRC